MLRQNKITVDDISLNVAKKKLMVIEHQSEFPIKLRPKIAARAANFTNPVDFLVQVELDFLSFIEAGRCQGPDRSVDSEEEIEVMLRLSPCVWHKSHRWMPLLAWSNAVHFLPLFWKLQKELAPSSATADEHLLSYYVHVLLTNNFESTDKMRNLRRHVEEYYGEDKQYGRESLLVLERMKKEGLLGDCSIVFGNVGCLFGLARKRAIPSLSFMEDRIRLMVQWDASIIERLWNHLVHWDSLCSFADDDWFSLFRLIFELGMTHFPMKLGYFFRDAHRIKMGFLFGGAPYRTASTSLYKSVAEVIQEIIPKYLRQGVTLRSLILAAAVDDDISLTGLYTLIGMDPSQLISVSAAKSKKRKLSAIQALAKSF